MYSSDNTTVVKKRNLKFSFDKKKIIEALQAIQGMTGLKKPNRIIVLSSYGQNPENGINLKLVVWHFSSKKIQFQYLIDHTIDGNQEQHGDFYMGFHVMRGYLPPPNWGDFKGMQSLFGFVSNFDDDQAPEYVSRIPQGMPPSYVLEASDNWFQTGFHLKEPLYSFKWQNKSPVEQLSNGNTSDYCGGHLLADKALGSHLCFLYQGEYSRIDTLFRQTGLMRDKWDEKHFSTGVTYGQIAIDRAIAGTTSHYDSASGCGELKAGLPVNGDSLFYVEEWPEPMEIKSALLPVKYLSDETITEPLTGVKTPVQRINHTPKVKTKIKNDLAKLISINGNTLITNSMIVAEKFGKRHDNVIRKIENLISAEKKGRLNFEETSHMDSWNRLQKIYLIDKKSFIVLAMRFSGDEALDWQIKFVEAFEKMERILLHRQNASWQQARIEGKQSRLKLTDAIRRLVDLAKSNGSKNADKYFISITNMTYRQVFDLKKIPDQFRDSLGVNELYQLQLVEWKVAEWLKEALDDCLDYHDPYREIKKKLKNLIAVIGVINLNRLIAA
ncbi:Rha family transcriptional regulator [Desulfobacula sp.]|uniref:Rha family transcriptional regulator n=1 Tax=Desulfobacula sp. TaxID=2593537 RepID=UPI00260D458A|nr:Rha family transcriptional regulator [Desulfobacula sp.]